MNSIIKEDLEFIISSNLVDWECFRDKSVLITGANGMLPSYMVMTLLYLNRVRDMNIKVYALVRNISKAQKVFSEYSENDGLRFIVSDVTTPLQSDETFNYIIHAASQAAPSYYGKDPVGTFTANTLGTLYMLELAKKSQSNGFLYFSTGAVYGKLSDEVTFINESELGKVDQLEVRNCYAESKRAGENACVCYAHQYGIPTKIVRIFHTMGPMVNLNDGRIFSDFCKNISENKDLILKSDGSAKRAFLYIADAVIAYFKILLDGEIAKAYNVGGGIDNEISMKDLAYSLVSCFKEKNLNVVFDINDNDIVYAKMKTPEKRILPDLTKIESLGWRPSYSVLDSFYRTVMSIEESSNNSTGGGNLITLQPSVYQMVV